MLYFLIPYAVFPGTQCGGFTAHAKPLAKSSTRDEKPAKGPAAQQIERLFIRGSGERILQNSTNKPGMSVKTKEVNRRQRASCGRLGHFACPPACALSPPQQAEISIETLCIMSSGASMTKAQRDELIRLITSPPAGSKIAAAKDFGVDLALLVRTLELTPTERLQNLAAAQALFQELRAAKKTSTHE